MALLILAFCNAAAGEVRQAAPAAPSVEDVTMPALRVGVDPVSGALVSPGPESGGLAPLWSASRLPSGPLPVVRLDDGSLMIDLRGIFLTNAVASIGWNGRPTLGCADFGVDPAQYARWLTLTARPARAKVKE